MKELTIEQKAKAYDKAIERANELNYVSDNDSLQRKTIEHIFPELKESEDERMVKFIKNQLFNIKKTITENYELDVKLTKAIDWLEKQGQQKLPIEKLPEEMKTIGESLGFTTQEECDNYNKMVTELIMSDDDKDEQKPTDKIESKFKVKYAGSEYNVLNIKEIADVTYYVIEDEPNHIDYVKADNCEIISSYAIKESGSPNPTKPAVFSEQKSVDKVESKFKVGNWYQCTKDFFGRGVTFDKNTAYYCAKEGCLQNEYGCHIAIVKSLYDNFKLWTIDDAKKGDILADKYGVYIYDQLDISDESACVSICGYQYSDKKFEPESMICNKSDFYPATKEQRDTLMKAMADAGWEFDFEKKKLRKIDQKSYGQMEKCIDCQFNYTGYCNGTCILKNNEQKSADKEETKFKVGDWVVNPYGDVWHIDSLDGNIYQVSNKGKYNYFPIAKQDEMHLWTFADAKEGDVIVYKDEISLYKHDIKNCTKQETTFGGFVYYCCYDGKRFIMDSLYSLTEQDKPDIHPAAKEQRDLLFQKMHEAGYTFDFEKKELKEIEFSDVGHEYYSELLKNDKSDNIADYAYQCAYCMSHDWIEENATWDDVQKACRLGAKWQKKHDVSEEWSEKDENTIKVLMNIIRKSEMIDSIIYTDSLKEKLYDWLKSLRPQNMWKVVDKGIYVKEPALAQKKDKSEPGQGFVVCYDHTLTPDVYERYIMLSDINCHSGWKPSDEQITVLELASKYERVFTPKQIDILIGLKEQLKKLKK